MSEQRRLGRGLEALLSQSYQQFAGPGAPSDAPQVYPAHAEGGDGPSRDGVNAADASGSIDAARDDGIVYISVHDITPNRFQPRQDFNPDELAELAESIRQHGLIQPIVVRRVDGGEAEGRRIELISGERRLRAAILAGWEQMPCLVREADDRQVAEIAIVENVQRKDLNPLEKAASFQSYLDTYGCTKEELAARVQVDRSTVANLVRLLELPEEAQNLIRCGLISQSHARALLPLGDEWEQVALCRRIVDEQLSVRAVEEIVTAVIRRLDDERSGDERNGDERNGEAPLRNFPLSDAPHGCVPYDGQSHGGLTQVDNDAAMRDALAALAGSVDSATLAELASAAGESGAPHSATISSKPKPSSRSRSSHIASLEQELRAALGTKIEIREHPRRRGRGQIIVHFSSNEEFERLHRYLIESATAPPQSEAG